MYRHFNSGLGGSVGFAAGIGSGGLSTSISMGGGGGTSNVNSEVQMTAADMAKKCAPHGGFKSGTVDKTGYSYGCNDGFSCYSKVNGTSGCSGPGSAVASPPAPPPPYASSLPAPIKIGPSAGIVLDGSNSSTGRPAALPSTKSVAEAKSPFASAVTALLGPSKSPAAKPATYETPWAKQANLYQVKPNLSVLQEATPPVVAAPVEESSDYFKYGIGLLLVAAAGGVAYYVSKKKDN